MKNDRSSCQYMFSVPWLLAGFSCHSKLNIFFQLTSSLGKLYYIKLRDLGMGCRCPQNQFAMLFTINFIAVLLFLYGRNGWNIVIFFKLIIKNMCIYLLFFFFAKLGVIFVVIFRFLYHSSRILLWSVDELGCILLCF